MKNKKGFAISVVLYALVILIIGIFYLLLGIIRNRYDVGNNLKNQIINGINPGFPSTPIALKDVIEYKEDLTESDSDGTKYVTGSNPDNYVWYSGKLWRIVAINSDGTIKLVTQNAMTAIAWDKSSTNKDYSTSQIRSWLNNEFLPTLSNIDDLLSDSTWDYTAYANGVKTKLEPETSSIITGEKVGLLTIYDYRFSGSFLNIGYEWWTMSPYENETRVWSISRLNNELPNSPVRANGVRPSVNLKSGVKLIGGTGKKNNPYKIDGDKTTGISSELLSTRISGEYINFNNVLYRIVGIEEVNGKKLTKVTMADYSVNDNTITTLAFGASLEEKFFSPTYGIGLYLEEWYQADSTSETYADTYIKGVYKNMIATSNDDGVFWYTGPTSGVNYDYTLSNTVTKVSATIGLGRYGEMFSSHFGDNYSTSIETWLITRAFGGVVWYAHSHGYGYYGVPTDSNGVRPSFYLKANVKITSGTGMPHDPYEISL